MNDVESSQDADTTRRRAKHSKTRKGCLRCKQRHIKCDEDKPACTRCIHASLPCPGYEDDTTRVRRGPLKRIRIIQVPQNIPIAPSVKHVTPEHPLPTPVMEQSAIDFFTTHTLTTLAKYAPETHLWTMEAFTQLLADAKIRNICIAIGLAHQEMRVNAAQGRGPYTSIVQAERHGTASPQQAMNADRYYNASLGYMRLDISTVRESATAERTDVAAACLLIVIYLSLQDRMEEAAVHMSCGMEVVNEGGEAFLKSSQVNQEIYLLFLHFATSSYPIHPLAALYDVMQGTLSLSVHLSNLDALTQLRVDLDLLAQRIYIFTAHVTRGILPDARSVASAQRPLTEDLGAISERIEARMSMPHPTTSMDDVFLHSLKARLKLYRIFTASVPTRYQSTYDRHNTAFDETIDLLWHTTQRGSTLIGLDWPLLSINLSLIGTLRQVALLCRHPSIRRRAHNMLKYVPQREGIVQAGEEHQLASIAIQFEEHGCNMDPKAQFTLAVPEENRLHFVESIRQAQLLSTGTVLEAGEIMVRFMYRPDGDSSYVERRIRARKEHFKLQHQKVLTG